MEYKTWFTVLITAAIALAGIKAHAQNESYTLKGTMGRLQPPAKAYLFFGSAAGAKTDSATFHNGKFNFSGTLDQPRQAVLYVSKKGAGLASSEDGSVVFYLESGNIYIRIPDSIQNAAVLGGPVNSGNNQLNKALRKNNAGLKKLRENYAAKSPQQMNVKGTRDSLTKQTDLLIAERKSIYRAFIKKHPASMMSLFALKSFQVPVANVNEVEPMFHLLSASVRMSLAGQRYAAELAVMKHIEIGAAAPDFFLPDTSGKVISLHDYKGKYVLIDFWASWCAPCRAENPHLLTVYSAYAKKDFAIISVSIDNAKNSWMNAIHEDRLPWTQVSDLKGFNPGGIAQLYAIHGVPQNFLIDPNGKIIDKTIQGTDLTGKLKKIFGL
ncbi:MAG: AhpC/TSA family protein [Bacteroidota bacterium]|nr:AhpC/TSA family protein [Bacteroidota bacterium]